MSGKFDITAAFAQAVGSVSKSDTDREAIEYIGLDKLEADPGNFYSLDGLEDLASNIQLCGLQQPIRVRPSEDGRYVIVSGHRRPGGGAAGEGPKRYRLAARLFLPGREPLHPEGRLPPARSGLFLRRAVRRPHLLPRMPSGH